MVNLAEKWLLEYFSDNIPRRSGELEDDFAGEPSLYDQITSPLGRWFSTPFFPALARLVDKGLIVYKKDDNNHIWYASPGYLPKDLRLNKAKGIV